MSTNASERRLVMSDSQQEASCLNNGSDIRLVPELKRARELGLTGPAAAAVFESSLHCQPDLNILMYGADQSGTKTLTGAVKT